MFQAACRSIRESLYCCIGLTHRQQGEQLTASAGTATGFMISPGVLVTAAHFLHVKNDPVRPRHTQFEVVRARNIGQQPPEAAEFIAEDASLDIGLLKVINARNNDCVTLEENEVSQGLWCGFLGYPVVALSLQKTGAGRLVAAERFQGAFLSTVNLQAGQAIHRYEMDHDMYAGSSGCPGFRPDGVVIGMQLASPVQPVPGGSAAKLLSISFLVPSADLLRFARTTGMDV